MAIVDDVMKDKITLHGLGFIQVQLQGGQRLHVWHPDLPRRRCFEHSCIHDHRFAFTSTVLIGAMVNQVYTLIEGPDGLPDVVGPYISYIHEGPRTACGGRPWVPDGRLFLREMYPETVEAGQSYTMPAYLYHKTEPLGDGRVATIMRKTWEGLDGAHSLCLEGVQPDAEFDRFQLSPERLWLFVRDVLEV